MDKRRRPCVLYDMCGNHATPRTKYCHTCGAGLHYWVKRRAAHVLERRRKLKLYEARINTIIEEREL